MNDTEKKKQITILQSHLKKNFTDGSCKFALKICFEALSKEFSRIERDEKLRLKFQSAKDENMDQDCYEKVRVGGMVVGSVSNGCSNNYKVSSEKSSLEHVQNEDEEKHRNRGNSDEDWEDVQHNDVGIVDIVVDHEIMIRGARNEDSLGDKMEYDESMNLTTITTSSGVSPLGRKLAEESVTLMNTGDNGFAMVRKPLAAIALALHCAMISPTLGFRCTGCVPIQDIQVKTAAVSGFAKPIRELPKNMIVPKSWDMDASRATTIPVDGGLVTCGYVAFRYRKHDVGNVVLRLILLPIEDDRNSSMQFKDRSVKIQFIRNGEEEPLQNDPLQFALNQHLNLTSFEKASESNETKGLVNPILHFKSLSSLMDTFSSHFDLGHIEEKQVVSSALQDDGTKKFVDAYVSMLPKSTPLDEGNKSLNDNRNTLGKRPGRSPALDYFGSSQRNKGLFQGDFSGDLLPSGLVPPGQHVGTGNLMGPNHPYFIGKPKIRRDSVKRMIQIQNTS